MSSMMKSIAGQPIAVNVSLISTIPSHCERSTIKPMSTTLIGISGSITSRKAYHFSLAALHHTDKLIIFGAACLPALHHIIPRTGPFLKQPALYPGIEVSGERAIEHIFLLCLVVVGRDLDVKLIAQRYGGRHPDLAQFVVAVALEAVCELLAMHFQVIGEAKPLDGEQEHPVHSLL